MSRWFRIAVVASLLAGSAKADDVQVNTYTTGEQVGPSVGSTDNGDYVVVWSSQRSAGSDHLGYSIQGQRFASNGSPMGGEFQVNTYITGDQNRPAVAVGAGGDFVVVWSSEGSSGTDTYQYSIQGQRYSSDGAPIGGQFQVNTYTPFWQFNPAVAMSAQGDFVVVWTSDGSYSTDSEFSIQGQRFASNGVALGGEFQVNSYTSSGQNNSSVAMDTDGNFVVVWGSSGNATDELFSVQGQRYASDGATVGGEFRVNSHTPDYQGRPSVAMDADGDFVVAWTSWRGAFYDIQAQLYDSDGLALGDEFRVNTYTTNFQIGSSVAMDADGDFLVVWFSVGSTDTDSLGSSIQAQRYSSDGDAVGDEFQVNTYTTGDQAVPSVASDTEGDFVVVWRSDGSAGTDSSGTSIQRTFVEVIFADGFESGDTNAWSNVRHFGRAY